MIRNLENVRELFELKEGESISKRSKNKLFTGDIVNNSPQRGINWIGEYPNIKLVILTTKIDSGYDDRWLDSYRFLYYFMIDHRHTLDARLRNTRTENLVLSEYDKHKAPILLLINPGKPEKNLIVAGWFYVNDLLHDDKKHHDFEDSVELIKIS